MPTKEFHKTSNEHAGVNVGAKFKTIKPHHEVQGDIGIDVELTLIEIAHYPTLYKLKDNEGKVWTVPLHTVTPVKE
tara:strand:- start:17 stop:244 length:228 start_codon:yes stop_codon:yes gene_type:complete